ncbi:MAG: hypothetical protein ACI9YL_001240 [Luteibaculaceae bacterium]|jgi:hypothetical protein
MKIVDATWEKRNLGVDCKEIFFEKGDNNIHFIEQLKGISAEYTVVKIPVSNIELSYFLQENGFKFMEAITQCYHKAELPVLPKIYNRFIDNVTCDIMVKEDVEDLFQRIRNNLFVDDRVSLDPEFTIQQANNRYVGWVNDELEKGSVLYKIIYKDKPIGFFNMRDKGNGNFFASIGGIYPEFQNGGFGVCMNYHQIQKAMKLGAKRIYTAFSSNNIGSYAIHLLMSYQMEEQNYVFVRHLK